MNPTVTVIIVTLNRPGCVERCLDCLLRQTRRAEQLIVVDASPDDLTRKIVARFEGVLYLRNDHGIGKMTVSRNIGLRRATGDIIAFIDDDAFADPQWLQQLLPAFDDPAVGAAGGRVHSNPRNTGTVPPEQIGRLTPNGIFVANFWADAPGPLDVEHIMGCNMSFRRDVVARLGGFREFLKGISGVGEDTEMCVRVRRLGYRMRYMPAAAVDHIGAQQVKGRRFDWRYSFFAGRNYNILLLRNFGLFRLLPWRYAIYSNGRNFLRLIKHPGDLGRACCFAAGTGMGWCIALGMLLRHGTRPQRLDPAGAALRQWLMDSPARPAPGATTAAAIAAPLEEPA